jgi:hypothetical protein
MKNKDITLLQKCSDIKNVVVASSDTEIYFVVQGDIKKNNRPCLKKHQKWSFRLDHLPNF